MKARVLGAAVLLGAMVAFPIAAHHSFAMFDNTKTMTLEGTVKEVQWANPHIWVQLLVKDPGTGKEVEWSIEGASPNNLSRRGWTRKSVQAGDKATVVMHPLRSGELGGTLLSVTVNGQTIGSPPAQ